MFNKIITETALTAPGIENLFNITGDSIHGDVSFVSTLRALVCPRMKEDERIYFRYRECRQRDFPIYDPFKESDTLHGEIVLYNISDYSDATAPIHHVEKRFEEDPHWARLNKVTDFFRKSFYVSCFIDSDNRNVVICAADINIKKIHYLQCAILAFLPWYFDPAEGVSEIEMALIKSLRERTASLYESCINKIAEQHDIRSATIKRLLLGFDNMHEQHQCDLLRNEISRINAEISNLNSRIGVLLSSKGDKEIALLGYETKIVSKSDEDSEIMNYFLCNKKLSVRNVESTRITFVVKDYLEYFDEDMAKSVIDNDTSYVYYCGHERGYGTSVTESDMCELMRAIFIDQTLKVRFCAAYQIDVQGSVRAISHYSYGIDCMEYMPNPHIDSYSCLGNYNQIINELLTRHDYIGAIEQCHASCKSLNFADSTVMREFMKSMYHRGNGNRCIELPNGNIVSPSEAIVWLREERRI